MTTRLVAANPIAPAIAIGQRTKKKSTNRAAQEGLELVRRLWSAALVMMIAIPLKKSNEIFRQEVELM